MHLLIARSFLSLGMLLPLAVQVQAQSTAPATSPAAASAQKLVLEQSSIGFTSKQMGVPVDGKFSKFDAQLSFDPKQAAAAKISFSVDMGSAVIGDADTTKELRKPEWFSLVKFPTASFVSTAVKPLGAGKFEVAGNLNIKGNQKPIAALVQLTQKGGTTLVEGGFAMKRLDFKIGDGEWNDLSIVANEVVVKLKLSLTGVAPL